MSEDYIINSKFLVSLDEPDENEFFRLKNYFAEIAKDPKNSEFMKIQLLIQKANQLYDFLAKKADRSNKIKLLKYQVGEMNAIHTEMSISEGLKETERILNIYYDTESARINYLTIIQTLQKRMEEYKIYQPFFDSMLNILGLLSERMKELQNMAEIEREKDALGEELKNEINERMRLEESIEESNKKHQLEINALRQKFKDELLYSTKEMVDAYTNLMSNKEMIVFLSKLEEIKTIDKKNIEDIAKFVSYCIMNNTLKVHFDELSPIGIFDIECLRKQPFISIRGQTITLKPKNFEFEEAKKIHEKIIKKAKGMIEDAAEKIKTKIAK